ncbi:dUTPase [Colletotrichum navitas]|uniref:dUTPase n=1 Tax=Colletotrichum navitas TaxID=681940 RepID=A0AAD8V7T5_9PEZI|nr:dUTPase [Colletotrichum navitas]KAK1595563.1 dUTPase [Colletotrichum navitas]
MRVLLSLSLITSVCASPITHWVRRDTDWDDVVCSDPTITDAKVAANLRWAAADTNTSWKEALDAWRDYKPEDGAVKLKFPAFISDFYGGPEGWDCQDPVNTPCSTSVKCEDTKHPAGFLLLNSFSKLHDVYKKYHEALQDAQISLLSAMGDFTKVFAPQLETKDQTALVKTMLDVLQFGIGVASAVIKNAGIFATSAYLSFSKDSFNSAVSSSLALSKDNLKAAKDAVSVQNDLTSAMGTLFDYWKKTQSDYLSEIFSGSNQTTITMLDSLIRDGMMNMLPVDINLSDMTKLIQTIIYGQMIPTAWVNAPAGFAPFVLKTGDACSDTMPKTLHPYMTQDTHEKAGVCWLGNQFYVLTVGVDSVNVQDNTPGLPDSEPPFQVLSGGTRDVLDGTHWGGITLEDIVISSFTGYQLNGNRNGYNITLDDSQGAVNQLMFAKGVQTPGFFSLPVCTNLWNTLIQISGGPSNREHYPCGVEVERPILTSW